MCHLEWTSTKWRRRSQVSCRRTDWKVLWCCNKSGNPDRTHRWPRTHRVHSTLQGTYSTQDKVQA